MVSGFFCDRMALYEQTEESRDVVLKSDKRHEAQEERKEEKAIFTQNESSEKKRPQHEVLFSIIKFNINCLFIS